MDLSSAANEIASGPVASHHSPSFGVKEVIAAAIEIANGGPASQLNAKRLHLTADDILGAARAEYITCIRHRAMNIAYRWAKKENQSYPRIGRKFGGRDPKTVAEGIQKIEAIRLAPAHPLYRETVDFIAAVEYRLFHPDAPLAYCSRKNAIPEPLTPVKAAPALVAPVQSTRPLPRRPGLLIPPPPPAKPAQAPEGNVYTKKVYKVISPYLLIQLQRGRINNPAALRVLNS
ncbi:MAG: helix-turn-helix domain-containing protein [Alphaproteobacteria bacterium]|nr:helix-turn-helix domain-containing protein [Alphaproteobacteria bacterium]